MERSDKQLIEAFLSGDDAAFEELVKKYLKPVYNFLYQLTGDSSALDDLTQVAFIKAWKNIKRFDRERNFKTWIFTIAKNTAYDYLKKKKTTPFSFFEDSSGANRLENIGEDKSLPDEILIKVQSAEELDEKLKKIPDQYRIILVMRYKDDLSLQEIAEILVLPYNTVKSQHQRALARLKKELT
jgi:RNA polymerase sigma-70 factor (ECF subfamily)